MAGAAAAVVVDESLARANIALEAETETENMNTHGIHATAIELAVLFSLFASCASSKVSTAAVAEPASSAVSTFETPEQAMLSLEKVIGTHDPHAVERLFGPSGEDILQSGDPVADQEDAKRVQQDIREKLAFEDRGPDMKVALLGDEGWPFPIPLVRDHSRWRFDTEAGREEIATRRIGRNELDTIASLHAYVDAQREYFSEGHDGNPPAYARKVVSSEGKHDGLYWATTEGEPESPLGPLMAAADREGYKLGEGAPDPYHGYYYRTLLGQGKSAPGGARSYVDEKGAMTNGFAVIAWPAKYGNSGVMTFMVDAQGIVFQKDLGNDTESLVAKFQTYDPDQSWDPTGD